MAGGGYSYIITVYHKNGSNTYDNACDLGGITYGDFLDTCVKNNSNYHQLIFLTSAGTASGDEIGLSFTEGGEAIDLTSDLPAANGVISDLTLYALYQEPPTYTPHGHIGTWHMEWVPGEDDYSAMRGPCSEGYHVPLSSEWAAVKTVWTTLGGGSSDGTNFGIALKLPFAGARSLSNATIINQGADGRYWSSSRNNANNASHLYFHSSGIYPQDGNGCAFAESVRPLKDIPVAPTAAEVLAGPVSTGTIAPSTSGPTLSLWTATENCTCIISGSLWSGGTGGVTYADLYKNGTQVNSKNSGFISGSVSFEMQVEVSSGDVLTLQTSRGSSSSGAVNNVYVSISNGWSTLYDGSSTATGAGIFWNATDGLISLSSDGTTWITIADKNLGATQVWNSGDTLSEANCGKYFQWGNNYGFDWTGTLTDTSTTQVDASNYGPGNYYSSSTFIKNNTAWDSPYNSNLWGGVTGVVVLPGHYKRRTY